jgi:hypothetical protein
MRSRLSAGRQTEVVTIVLPIADRDLEVEVKTRAGGFRELYGWLDGRDVLILKPDRQEPLVLLPAVAGGRDCQTES